MIIINPLEWDVEQFLTELDLEIRFMQIHNLDDEIEIVLNDKTYRKVKKYLSVYEFPKKIDNSMINDTIDVRLI